MRRFSTIPSLEGFSPVEQVAAGWLILRDQGLSPTQQAEFERWYAASPNHAEIYDELEETWSLFDIEKEVTPLCRFLRIARFALPLAAALTLGYFAWWSPAQSNQNFEDVAITELGRLQSLKLPDGSTLLLNSESAVKVHFTPDERRLKLVRGQVHFTVAKNPNRPFIVEIGTVTVRAVGTAFDIRLRSEVVEVLVTEGKVRIDEKLRDNLLLPASTSAGLSLLSAGERLVIPIRENAASVPRPRPVPMEPREVEQALAWRRSRLDFVAAPLSEIVEEFNRYNRHKLVVAHPGLAAQRFGGNFRTDETATFVRLLGERFSVVVEERENETILRLAP